MLQIRSKHSNQSGLVSIMVVGIIAVLLTLLVLEFSRVSSRDLRQSIDRQISAQANYAAETGINDALKKLKAGTLADQADCNSGVNAVYGSAANANVGNSGASVTCVLVTGQSSSYLRADNQPVGTSKVFVINNVAWLINALHVSWDGGSVLYNSNGTSNFGSSQGSSNPEVPLPSVAGWSAMTSILNTDGNKPAVLEITIIPVANDPNESPAYYSASPAGIRANTQTYYFYPQSDNVYPEYSAYVNYNQNYSSYSNESGSIVTGACNRNSVNTNNSGTPYSAYACNASIEGLPGGNNCCTNPGGSKPPFAVPYGTFGGTNWSNNINSVWWGRSDQTFYPIPDTAYYLIVKPLYNDASYTIAAYNSGVDKPVYFKATQTIIDVTAKAGDVIKRIQVRANTGGSANSIGNTDFIPGYGIESANTLCKQLLIPSDASGAVPADADPACGL